MYSAKISSDGQITVPIEIRRALGLKTGDNILFLEKPGGEVVITNASANAIYKAQRAFEGAADSMGIQSEDDVQALIDGVRYEKDSPHNF